MLFLKPIEITGNHWEIQNESDELLFTIFFDRDIDC